MSLLDKGRETIILYNEETYLSPDGNPSRRASSTPVTVTNCVIQPASQSGTSQRREEQDNEGFESESTYRLRPPRWFTTVIGMMAKIEWRGEIWSVVGKEKRYNGSSRTAHIDYTIRRN